MKWNDLSMKDRATLILLGVASGVYDIGTIKDTYNSYAKGGDTQEENNWTLEDENNYNEWRMSLPENLKYETSNYDLRGAYLSGSEPMMYEDGFYHLNTRDPRTGKYLKAAYHPSTLIGLLEDKKIGYYPDKDTRKNGIHTNTWEGQEWFLELKDKYPELFAEKPVFAEEPLYNNTPYTSVEDFFERWYPNRKDILIENMALLATNKGYNVLRLGNKKRAKKNVDRYIESVLDNDKEIKEFQLNYLNNYGTELPSALKDPEARAIIKNYVKKTYKKDTDRDWDLSFYGMFGKNGFTFPDYPHYIFYDDNPPSFNTRVHERTHTLQPKDEQLYKKYDYGTLFGDIYNPMEYKAYNIKDHLYYKKFFSDKTVNKLFSDDAKNNKDLLYYSNIDEIVARLNAIRATQGINPKRIVTKEDLKTIRENASKIDREGFLDLYTDEALLNFFNLIAQVPNERVSNVAAFGGLLFGPGGELNQVTLNLLLNKSDWRLALKDAGMTAILGPIGSLIPLLRKRKKTENTVDTNIAEEETNPVEFDWNDLRLRQAWTESKNDAKAVSPRGAKGVFLIMDATLLDYQKKTGDIGDIFDPEYNGKVRDYYLNWLMERPVVNTNNPPDSILAAKAMAAYNWGVGNLTDYLIDLKKQGNNIYTSLDWVEGLPKETRDYVNFIVRHRDSGGHRTNNRYKKAFNIE